MTGQDSCLTGRADLIRLCRLSLSLPAGSCTMAVQCIFLPNIPVPNQSRVAPNRRVRVRPIGHATPPLSLHVKVMSLPSLAVHYAIFLYLSLKDTALG